MKVHCEYTELRDIQAVKGAFHPKNVNSHPIDQIERLAKVLEYQGFRYPIKISKLSGFVTSGHGRALAAAHLGWEKVPVSLQEYESEEQELADLVADNAIAAWSELDFSAINMEVPSLGPDFDIDLLGIKNFVIEPFDKPETQAVENGPTALEKLEKYLGKEFLEIKLQYNQASYDEIIAIFSDHMAKTGARTLSESAEMLLKQWKG